MSLTQVGWRFPCQGGLVLTNHYGHSTRPYVLYRCLQIMFDAFDKCEQYVKIYTIEFELALIQNRMKNRNLPHRQAQHHRAQWQPLCWSPPNHLNPQCPRLPSHRGPISSRIHFSPNLVCAATCFCEIWDLLLWASKALACKSLPGVHSVQFCHQLITVWIKISCQAKNYKFEVVTFWLAQTFETFGTSSHIQIIKIWTETGIFIALFEYYV